ncbi:MAG: Abi-alpha family protein [Pseudomonadota bacterium]
MDKRKLTSALPAPLVPRSGTLYRLRSVFGELPPVQRAAAVASGVENQLLLALRNRLQSLDGTQSRSLDESADTLPTLIAADTAGILRDLHQRSIYQTKESATEDLVRTIVQQLVPDELRVLALVSDEGPHAMCHLDVAGRMGKPGYRLRGHLSRIAQESGLMLAQWAPHYLNHMIQLGLLDTGPVVKTLERNYESIENGLAVRALAADVERQAGAKVRFQRLSFSISDLGKTLWTKTLDCRDSD